MGQKRAKNHHVSFGKSPVSRERLLLSARFSRSQRLSHSHTHTFQPAARRDVQRPALLRPRGVVHVRARLLDEHARHVEAVRRRAHVQAGPTPRHVQVAAAHLGGIQWPECFVSTESTGTALVKTWLIAFVLAGGPVTSLV